MNFYLGIYCKSDAGQSGIFDPVIHSFHLNGTRAINTIEHPGFCLYYSNQKNDGVVANSQDITLVSGFIHSMPKSDSMKDQIVHCNDNISEDPKKYLAGIDGAFTMVYYNKIKHQLILANDKFGVFPMFIWESKDYIVFSNEYEPLCFIEDKLALNYNAIAEFFTLGSVLGSKTFLANINRLAPASLLVATKTNATKLTYWQPDLVTDFRDPAIIAREVHDLFVQVNNQTLRAGITEVHLLSAGADSRLILATMNEETRSKVDFYTSNLSFLSEEEDKDVIGAKRLAERFGLNHKVEKIAHYENIFGDLYFKNSRIQRDAKVYGGWHGGEFLGGFCLSGSPIFPNVTKKSIDDRLKIIFSRKFRREITMHPFESYAAMDKDNYLFYLHQFIHPFFTTIYSGSRGYWLQPFQLTNRGYSPFWDSRIIQKILTLPIEVLSNYNFYNEVFRYVDPVFLKDESNSPLAAISGSVLKPLDIGIEPKKQLPNVHDAALKKCLVNKRIWSRNFYRDRKLKRILQHQDADISKRWLDFEVWLTYYMCY